MSSALAVLPEDFASGLGSDRGPVGPGGFENPEGPEDFSSPDELASDIPGLAEARAIAQFSDANIVTVYNFEVKDSMAYLIMEYVEGTTLERFLREHDGDLTLALTHPRFAHEKTYIVRVAGRWSEEKLRILRGPVAMPDGYVTRPVPVEGVRPAGRDNVAVLAFRLREGRKRQIRYMCSAAHLVVLSLKRVAVGALRLPEDLKPGAWRDLTPDERRLLV